MALPDERRAPPQHVAKVGRAARGDEGLIQPPLALGVARHVGVGDVDAPADEAEVGGNDVELDRRDETDHGEPYAVDGDRLPDRVCIPEQIVGHLLPGFSTSSGRMLRRATMRQLRSSR